jgi:hypothetical protein
MRTFFQLFSSVYMNLSNTIFKFKKLKYIAFAIQENGKFLIF